MSRRQLYLSDQLYCLIKTTLKKVTSAEKLTTTGLPLNQIIKESNRDHINLKLSGLKWEDMKVHVVIEHSPHYMDTDRKRSGCTDLHGRIN